MGIISHKSVIKLLKKNLRVKDEYEDYLKELQEGKEQDHEVISKRCMSCGSSSASLHGPRSHHTQHRMCLLCWKSYYELWHKSREGNLYCPFSECWEQKVLISQTFKDKLKSLKQAKTCNLCQALTLEVTQCCKSTICEKCVRKSAKTQFIKKQGESLSKLVINCPQCGINVTAKFSQIIKEQNWSASIKKQVENEIRKKQFSCLFCQDNHAFQNTNFVSIPCGHTYCREMLQNYLISVARQSNSSEFNCSTCQSQIPLDIVTDLVPDQDLQNYNQRVLAKIWNINIVKCANETCQELQAVSQEDQQYLSFFRCPKCHTKTCLKCYEKSHVGTKCKPRMLIKKLIEIRAALPNALVMSCPYCLTPFSKDEMCNHVTCGNIKCGQSFCFVCSAKRNPILAHGNHYHRPGCENYAAFKDKNKNPLPNCTECQRLGKKCTPPRKLENNCIPEQEWPDFQE